MVGKVLSLACLSLFLFSACQADQPGLPKLEPTVPGGKSDQGQLVPGQPVPPGGSDPAARPQFELFEYTPQTRYYSVPLKGQGPAGGLFVYSIDTRGIATELIDKDGTFCVDIPLGKGERLEVVAYVVDALGRESDRLPPFKLEQVGEPPQPHAPPQLEADFENLTFGQPVYTHNLVLYDDETRWDMLTDGNPTNGFYYYQDWGALNRILIPLAHRAQVDTVILKAPSECNVSGKVHVYFSDKPEVPGLRGWGSWGGGDDEARWDRPQYTEKQAGVFKYSKKFFAKWVHIETSNNWINGNCGQNWLLAREYGGFSEIEVWGSDARPPNTPAQPPPEPTCLTGAAVQ
jgi:hypothetical protein